MAVAVAVLAFLLLLNAIFAMSELAMMTSRPSRLQAAAAKGDRGAAAALRLARDPTRFLSTVQVGITLIGILAGAYGERAISATVEGWIGAVPALAPHANVIALVLVVLAITYLTLVLGELVPKRLALAYPELVASRIARPLGLLSWVAALPVRVLSASTDAFVRLLRIRGRSGDDVSEDDVKSLVARAATTGVFDPTEHRLFQRVFRLGDLDAGSLMVPRSEIVWIDESMASDSIRVLVGTSPFSHYPVCQGGIDRLVGVVHIKDLIAYGLVRGEDFHVSAVAQPPMFVPETMPVTALLDLFQRTRSHIAFVVDEYGGTEGLITLNDVTEAIVGDLSRKGEEEAPQATRRTDGSWLIDGRLPLLELLDTIEIPRDAAEELASVNTAAGLFLTLVGHVPHVGETVAWRGWTFEVVDMDGRRVDQIMVSRTPTG